MQSNLKSILAIMGVSAAFFTLTAFTPRHAAPLQPAAPHYKAHAVEMALICGSNDLQDDCYGRQMAKYLARHGDKQRAAAIMAGIKPRRASTD